MGAFADTGEENFPDAGRAEIAQRMNAAVPIIEFADDADALGVGGPDGEAGAVDAVHFAQVRAEFVVDAVFISLAEQEEVGLAEAGENE